MVINYGKWKATRAARMGDIDANPCASESPRPELSHAQGFISKSLTVASEYSTENPSFSEFRIFSPKFTSFSCMKMCAQFCDNKQIMIIYLCRSRRFADISHCVVASVKDLGAIVTDRCSKPCAWENSDPTHRDSDFEKKCPIRSFHIKTVTNSARSIS